MRYATWALNFDDNPQEGTTPELQLATLGLTAEGVFYISSTKIAGYINGEGPLTGLEKWQVEEITAEEFLNLAKNKNQYAALDNFGMLTSLQPLQGTV